MHLCDPPPPPATPKTHGKSSRSVTTASPKFMLKSLPPPPLPLGPPLPPSPLLLRPLPVAATVSGRATGDVVAADGAAALVLPLPLLLLILRHAARGITSCTVSKTLVGRARVMRLLGPVRVVGCATTALLLRHIGGAATGPGAAAPALTPRLAATSKPVMPPNSEVAAKLHILLCVCVCVVEVPVFGGCSFCCVDVDVIMLIVWVVLCAVCCVRYRV